MEKIKLQTLGTSHGDPTINSFNSSSLFFIEDELVLIDAGSPVNALMIRNGIDFNKLKAIFITHSHEDHFSGIIGIIKTLIKHGKENLHIKLFLPEQNCIDAIKVFMKAVHLPLIDNMFEFNLIEANKRLMLVNNVEISAFPTKHMEYLNSQSYGFCLENSKNHIIYTGDLKYDFSDFPTQKLKSHTSLICECTHYKMQEAISTFKKIRLKKLIFNHIGNHFQGVENELKLVEYCKEIPYNVFIAHDNDIFEL